MAHKGEKSNGSHYAAGRTGIVQRKAVVKAKKLVAEKKKRQKRIREINEEIKMHESAISDMSWQGAQGSGVKIKKKTEREKKVNKKRIPRKTFRGVKKSKGYA